MTLHPFFAVIERAREIAAKGGWVIQKFHCAKCSNVLSFEEANAFYTHGTCDKCGHLTNIQQDGCNHLVILGNNEKLALLPDLGITPPRFPNRITLYDCHEKAKFHGKH